MVTPLGFGLGVWHPWVCVILMSNDADCHGRPYTFDGILTFHLWYINIPARQGYRRISEEVAT
jgi:hypothetical protein